ncbi:MAG: hypothetical protein QOE35_3847 [Actinomycetota bacterium]|jgi:hypothetical protein
MSNALVQAVEDAEVVVQGPPAAEALRQAAAQLAAAAVQVERREQEQAAAARAAQRARPVVIEAEVLKYLMVFYRAVLWRVGEHVAAGGTAVGVGAVVKAAAIEAGLPVESIPLPRRSRHEEQRQGVSKHGGVR